MMASISFGKSVSVSGYWKHRHRKYLFHEGVTWFSADSDQSHGLMAHCNSSIHNMNTNTSCCASNEYFHDKPSDNSALFLIQPEYQLSLLPVTRLKWLCLWTPFMNALWKECFYKDCLSWATYRWAWARAGITDPTEWRHSGNIRFISREHAARSLVWPKLKSFLREYRNQCRTGGG